MNTLNIELSLFATFSTMHITEEEGRKFTEGEEVVTTTCWSNEYGVIFYIGGKGDHDFSEVSEGMQQCIQAAWTAGAEWIRFDRDGPVHDEFTQYDW